MNIIQHVKDQGRIEGKLEGKFEVALEMLKEGIDIEQISKFTRLTKDEVLQLKHSQNPQKKP